MNTLQEEAAEPSDNPMEEQQEAPSSAQSPVLELRNYASGLDDDTAKQVGQDAYESTELDRSSRSEWEEKHADWLKLYHQIDKEGANNLRGQGSTESVPILAEACIQYQIRAYQAFFPNRFFIDALPIGTPNQQTRERAERVGKHMSWQLGVLDRSYKRDKNQMFLATAQHGSDFTKTYYDPAQGKPVVERVRAQDLIVPYNVGPLRLEEIPRKTHVKMFPLNDTNILASRGWFTHPAEKMKVDDSNIMRQVEDEVQGLQASNMGSRYDLDYALLYEQHCFLDLDGDGIEEPYIVTIDATTKKLLRIAIRYETDIYGKPVGRDRKIPIEYFTHYQFLPNPDGFYGLGMGHLVGSANSACNKMFRMLLDAGKLANDGNMSGFVSEQSGIPGGELEMELGKLKKYPGFAEDIKKSIYMFNFPGPNAALLEMMQFTKENAERLTAITDALTGSPDKVYQPTTILTMVEQGLQLFSSIQEFQGYSLEEELQKVYKINQKYLTDEAYYIDGDQSIPINPEDYQEDLRVVPIFDPKYATRQQKLAKAQAIYEIATNNPLIASDQGALYAATKAVLEALDTENIDEMLPKPKATQPQEIDDQNVENSLFLLPVSGRPLFDVFPQQNHAEHVGKIDEFIREMEANSMLEPPVVPGGSTEMNKVVSQFSDEFTKQVISDLMNHRNKHLSFMVMNQAMAANPQMGTQNGIGSGSSGNMAPGQGNSEVSQGNLPGVPPARLLADLLGGNGGALSGPAQSIRVDQKLG